MHLTPFKFYGLYGQATMVESLAAVAFVILYIHKNQFEITFYNWDICPQFLSVIIYKYLLFKKWVFNYNLAIVSSAKCTIWNA